MSEPQQDVPGPSADAADATWRLVREALRGLRFGTVTLIVQDGLLIQVDRTEKTRVRRDSRRTISS